MTHCNCAGPLFGREHALNCPLHPKAPTEGQLRDEPGHRFDLGKPRHSLIPPEFLTGLANHFTIGAKKYADRNWEKGMSWSRCYDSLLRHVTAWNSGENVDVETGSHHMMAAAWNACVLYAYAVRGMNRFDDRVQTPSSQLTEFSAVEQAISATEVRSRYEEEQTELARLRLIPMPGQLWKHKNSGEVYKIVHIIRDHITDEPMIEALGGASTKPLFYRWVLSQWIALEPERVESA